MIEINSHVCQGMQTFRSKTFQVEQNVKNAVMPHSNIMNAILARDAAQAEREMRAHLDKVQEDLTQNIHAPGHETNNRNCPARQFETPSRTGAAGGFLLCPGREEDTVRLRQRCFGRARKTGRVQGKTGFVQYVEKFEKKREQSGN